VSQQINLYEERLRPSTSLATGKNLGLCALAVIVISAVLAVYLGLEAKGRTEAAAVVQKQLLAEQEKLSALAQSAAQRKISPALLGELENTKAMLAVRSEVIETLDSGKLGNFSGFSVFMTGFARQAQADLWLTGFQVGAGGDEIEIRGRLLDPAKLPLYVKRLSSEPIFQGRSFAALNMQSVDPGEPGADQPPPPRAGEKPAAGAAEPRLPRFLEFVLRSENAASLNAKLPAGAKP
jgi:hypothetical protein